MLEKQQEMIVLMLKVGIFKGKSVETGASTENPIENTENVQKSR